MPFAIETGLKDMLSRQSIRCRKQYINNSYQPFYITYTYFLTVKTGILEFRITLSATLPSKNLSIPLLPSVPITIRSTDCSSASLTISSAGFPSTIHLSVWIPSFFANFSIYFMAVSPWHPRILFNLSGDVSVRMQDSGPQPYLVSTT